MQLSEAVGKGIPPDEIASRQLLSGLDCGRVRALGL